MPKKPKFDPFDPKHRIGPLFYHVTPYDVWKTQISKQGLIPRLEKRGIYVDDPLEKRVYLFEDPVTADDAITNWIAEDWYPNDRWFALLEVSIPSWIREVHDDPELAGSYFVTEWIPNTHVRRFKKVDAGEPE
jgi:hypothetical protein